MVQYSFPRYCCKSRVLKRCVLWYNIGLSNTAVSLQVRCLAAQYSLPKYCSYSSHIGVYVLWYIVYQNTAFSVQMLRRCVSWYS